MLCTMSLQAWDWEEEERASMGPQSVASTQPSASESEMEEYLKSRIPAHDWDSEDPFSSSLHSSEGPACISDVPQIVPCRFEISLAFPVLLGRCSGRTLPLSKVAHHWLPCLFPSTVALSC